MNRAATAAPTSGSATARASVRHIAACSFCGNQAIAADGTAGPAVSGAIANIGSTLIVTDSAFTDNEARGANGVASGGANGGGFAAGGAIGDDAELTGVPPTATISASVFTGNRAVGGSNITGNGFLPFGDGAGGAIFHSDPGGNLQVTSCVFSHNEARGGDNVNGGVQSISGVGVGGAGLLAISAEMDVARHVHTRRLGYRRSRAHSFAGIQKSRG